MKFIWIIWIDTDVKFIKKSRQCSILNSDELSFDEGFVGLTTVVFSPASAYIVYNMKVRMTLGKTRNHWERSQNYYYDIK